MGHEEVIIWVARTTDSGPEALRFIRARRADGRASVLPAGSLRRLRGRSEGESFGVEGERLDG
ncbi:MAG: hypothetical protein OXR73_38550 [Myxococcales bacterium]|nr:hypothetical protein [Myxococcales bacterium]